MVFYVPSLLAVTGGSLANGDSACPRCHKHILLGCFISLASLQAAQAGKDLCIFILGLFLLEGLQKKKQALHFERAEVAHHIHLNLAIELIHAQKYLKWSPFNTLQILRYFHSFSCPAPNENSFSLRFWLLNFDNLFV